MFDFWQAALFGSGSKLRLPHRVASACTMVTNTPSVRVSLETCAAVQAVQHWTCLRLGIVSSPMDWIVTLAGNAGVQLADTPYSL